MSCKIPLLLCLTSLTLQAETISPLFGRGYTVLPAPQRVQLAPHDFAFTAGYRLSLGSGVAGSDMAVQSLTGLLAERFHLQLSGGANTHSLHLAIAPNTVHPDAVTDSDKASVAEQAYRLELTPDRIAITGNSAIGLFYGVQTFVQLLKPQNNTLWLPESTIEDWPDLSLRIIYWDDAHHLEHLDVLKAALKQASFYKINGFSIKLEGHFQYAHAAPIVEPYALTPAELQELTDYGLRYHVQVIPYLDAPAHVAFILKHPEYAALREYPDSNYEFCSTNPETFHQLEGMFDDLLAANKGGKYFVLSTDEPYYIGLAHNSQCQEAERAQQLGSVGKLFAEFVTKTAGYLHDRGRTVIFWGEFPMKPDDIGSLPSHLINGELYGPQFDPVFRARGIRQMVYTSTVAEEQLFPRYFAGPTGAGRLAEMFQQAAFTSLDSLSSTRPDSAQPNQADLTGIFVAGWADPGLHPETMWLGYAAGIAPSWHRATPTPSESAASFYRLFYGPQSTGIGRLYQLMCEQADTWETTWQLGPSSARTPIWGNSFGIFDPPKPAHDQFLPPLPVPSGDLLHLSFDWRAANAELVERAGNALAQNDELLDRLYAALAQVQFNRYNLAVYLSIARLYRQNLVMIQDLGRISDALHAAGLAAAKPDPPKALAELDRALNIAQNIWQARNQALQNATDTWYKSWFPRVAEANGRKYLDKVDDVKDHQPMRTIDMSYLVYRELHYPLDVWATDILSIRNRYAEAHQLPSLTSKWNWKDTGASAASERVADESDN